MSRKDVYDFLLGKRELVDDREWMELVYANSYALFMAYLSMAVKGLGFLVLTWTTVVLLGGFVSNLEKKDFWCLVFITLVQTAGIFDVHLNEKLGYLAYPFAGYTMVVFDRGFLLAALAVIQIVAFVVLLLPLVVVYMFGLFISSGIAVWRLREHDYGSNDRQHGNMKTALDVLYYLALLQNAMFCFKLLFGLAKGFIVNKVLNSRYFSEECHDGILDYLQETMIKCEKDPSCSRGRNLITYAVDLMGSKLPDDYLSGLRILDGFARYLAECIEREWQEENRIYFWSYQFMKQEHILMKHLIVPGYSSNILQKLLQTLGYRSIYDRETKKRAARIVASIAEDIRLQELPGGIHYISSLIDTLEEYHLLQPYQRDLLNESYQQDWMEVAFANKYRSYEEDYKKEEDDTDPQKTYKELMVQGFLILGKLATNVDNCRVMVDTPYLLSKIMAPVTSDLLHHIDHGAWSSIVEGSLKVMAQITAATGQSGTKLRSEISNSKEAISTMTRILGCHSDECKKLQKHVIWILGHLYVDSSLRLETASREKFTEMLVNIMTDDKEATQARQVTEPKEATQAAGEAEFNEYMEKRRVELANMAKEARRATAANTLVALSSKFETTATVIMKADDNAVHLLTTMIFQKHKCRLTAAQILEYLCIHYTNDDESLTKLQKTMIHSVPKVLREIVCADSQVNGLSNIPSSYRQRDYTVSDYAMIEMLSLCVTVCNRFISEDQDLARQFDAISPRDASFSFPKKLKEIVDKNKKPGPDRLRILKLTCKMVITMMKHRGTYVKEDLESLMDALSSASKEMFILDGSMVFNFRHDETTTPKPCRSLASLVKEARELVDRHDRLLSCDLSLWSPV